MPMPFDPLLSEESLIGVSKVESVKPVSHSSTVL
eukprot:SAG31_NODE_33983_length_338_cov_0.644351_1_plen_33_part_01